jgi:hypothetical protein
VIIRFKYAEKIPPFFRNKYFLTVTIFIIWLLLLDANNLIDRYSQMRELSKLKQDREYYKKKIEEDRKIRRDQY